MPNSINIKNSVQDYYGQTLKSSKDLQTDACCTADDMPDYAKPILAKVHDEVLIKYYGCGIILPEQIQGCSVLDLGSGSGRDCYVLSSLVGEQGRVVGVDMTDEQLEVANRHRDYMAEQFGYQESNVSFLKGDIEKLHELELGKSQFDCVISNCVVNLAQDKQAVLDQVFKMLRNGGEFYFSDVYSDRRIPADLMQDPVLYGECLSGALYWNDFLKMARKAGFLDVRTVTSRPLKIDNTDVQRKLGNIQFMSTTYRLFKIAGIEEDCEDYGQAVRYNGEMSQQPNFFELDERHTFERGRIYPVCGNTYLMLKESRFCKYFDFWGDFSSHLGFYQECSTGVVNENIGSDSTQVGSCC